MNDVIISFHEGTSPEQLNDLSPNMRKVFNWCCLTLNQLGYAPHVFDIRDNSMDFMLRRFEGIKGTIPYITQTKIVAVANIIFRMKQKYWAVSVVPDVIAGKMIHFWRIKITGEKRSYFDPASFDDDLGTENLSIGIDEDFDHQQVSS